MSNASTAMWKRSVCPLPCSTALPHASERVAGSRQMPVCPAAPHLQSLMLSYLRWLATGGMVEPMFASEALAHREELPATSPVGLIAVTSAM